MRKLQLSLDELSVDSFTTSDAASGAGTVEGYISTHCTNAGYTCNGANTCLPAGATCGNPTCFLSCAGSCPCYPPDPGDTTTGGGIQTAAYTCPRCEVSVNEVGTCIAPCH